MDIYLFIIVHYCFYFNFIIIIILFYLLGEGVEVLQSVHSLSKPSAVCCQGNIRLLAQVLLKFTAMAGVVLFFFCIHLKAKETKT